MNKKERTPESGEFCVLSTIDLSTIRNGIKKRGHGVGGLPDAEDPVLVLSASLVIDSMS